METLYATIGTIFNQGLAIVQKHTVAFHKWFSNY